MVLCKVTGLALLPIRRYTTEEDREMSYVRPLITAQQWLIRYTYFFNYFQHVLSTHKSFKQSVRLKRQEHDQLKLANVHTIEPDT